MNATPQQIVRCLKRDLDGDLEAGIRYAERIANYSTQPEMVASYGEAAKLFVQDVADRQPWIERSIRRIK